MSKKCGKNASETFASTLTVYRFSRLIFSVKNKERKTTLQVTQADQIF